MKRTDCTYSCAFISDVFVIDEEKQSDSTDLLFHPEHRTDETVAVRGKPLTPGGELSLTSIAENPGQNLFVVLLTV